MEASYSLQPNEVVLLREDSVMGRGTLASFSGELTLTNLNLVLLKKGMFGGVKTVRVFPLDSIKVHEKRAQARLGKASSGTDQLELYFLDGEQRFVFISGGKKKVNEWISKINEAVTGETLPIDQGSGMALPGAEMVAGVLKDTIGVFKSKFGAKDEAPAAVSAKCRDCGAPVAGFRGRTVACAYCGSAVQL